MTFYRLSQAFTTLLGLLLTPLVYVILTIKLLPNVAIWYLLILLIGLIAYPVSEWRREKRGLLVLGAIAKAILVIVTTMVIIRTYIVEPRYILGEAMMPTIQDRERLVGDKTSYWFRDPVRNDIVIFSTPDQRDVISRVIGLPGELFEIRDGQVYINGKALQEKYLDDLAVDVNEQYRSLKIPPRQYFMLSDRRIKTYDSRYSGLIARGDIQAKMTARMLSWQPLK